MGWFTFSFAWYFMGVRYPSKACILRRLYQISINLNTANFISGFHHISNGQSFFSMFFYPLVQCQKARFIVIEGTRCFDLNLLLCIDRTYTGFDVLPSYIQADRILQIALGRKKVS